MDRYEPLRNLYKTAAIKSPRKVYPDEMDERELLDRIELLSCRALSLIEKGIYLPDEEHVKNFRRCKSLCESKGVDIETLKKAVRFLQERYLNSEIFQKGSSHK